MFPVIYVKIAITVAIQANWLRLIPFMVGWLVLGPFVLFWQLTKDMFYYVKILCDYMDEEDQFKEKEEEDFRQDKIVIYNEVLDVMRSIAHLYRKKMMEAKAKRMALGQILSEFEEQQMFLIGDAGGNMDGKTSLTMEKSLIVEAWGRYRPNSKENSPKINA